MRRRIPYGVKVDLSGFPEPEKKRILHEGTTQYLSITLENPIKLEGHQLKYLVVPWKFTAAKEFEQSGKFVIACETEAEALETRKNLSEREKKRLGAFQTAGVGGVAWATNFRRIQTEIGACCAILSGGRTEWMAFERKLDTDSLEVTVIRSRRAATQTEAVSLAKQWQKESQQEREKALAAMARDVTPKPPPRCARLTGFDREDIAKAKMIALKRQWSHCFAIFDRHKADPKWRARDQEMEDAVLLDLCAHGRSDAQGSIRYDMQLISALHKAAQQYARRGKSKITAAALYLIAFNWELGWCYSSDEELAGKLTEILKKPFTAGQVKQFRFRTLGLLAKHLPGPDPTVPD